MLNVVGRKIVAYGNIGAAVSSIVNGRGTRRREHGGIRRIVLANLGNHDGSGPRYEAREDQRVEPKPDTTTNLTH